MKGKIIGLKKKSQERKEGSATEGLEKLQRPPGTSMKLKIVRGSLRQIIPPFVRQMSNYTKQDVLFQKRFGRFHAILIQKLYLMQVYKARGKRKCKCKRGGLSCGSPLCQRAASVLEVSCETGKFSQLEAVSGTQCVSRKGKKL